MNRGNIAVNIQHSIKFKIALAFGLCVLLMISIGMLGLSGLRQLDRKIHASYAQDTAPIVELADARAAQSDMRLQMSRIEILADPSATPAILGQIRASREMLKGALARYARVDLTGNAHAQAIWAKVEGILPKFDSITDQVLASLRTGDLDGGRTAQETLAPVAGALSDDLRQLGQLSSRAAERDANDSRVTYDRLFWMLAALLAAGALLGIGVSVYLGKAITRPLHRAVSFAHRIAEGRLDNPVDSARRDEFGQLLESLGKMDRQLAGTVRGIKASTESVTSASGSIACGNRDLSLRTEQQAASLEETAASMTELTETVKQNTDNARQANVLAINATQMADAGNESVQQMVDTIEQISGSSARISEITGVIEGIAFQTNILALNAAVEAARAGEQGRGFAVVAGEVRSLAQRSAAAAKEIKDLIATSVAMIQDGSKQASGVGATMLGVKRSIKQVSDIVGEIAAASEQQSRGMEQVHQAVSQMDKVTQQNSALVAQAASAAQSLDEQAAKLKEAVSVFTVSDVPSGFVADGTLRTSPDGLPSIEERELPKLAGLSVCPKE